MLERSDMQWQLQGRSLTIQIFQVPRVGSLDGCFKPRNWWANATWVDLLQAGARSPAGSAPSSVGISPEVADQAFDIARRLQSQGRLVENIEARDGRKPWGMIRR